MISRLRYGLACSFNIIIIDKFKLCIITQTGCRRINSQFCHFAYSWCSFYKY